MNKSAFTALALLLTTLGTDASATPVSKQEALLRQAMRPGPSADENGGRALSPRIVIRSYIKSGHVKRKPDERSDYVDYRMFKKPATFFGHMLVMIEEEYMTQYIGCCVNHGIGIIIEAVGSTDEVKAFVAENKCTIDHLQKAEDVLLNLNVTRTRGTTYHYISCRENDLIDSQ